MASEAETIKRVAKELMSQMLRDAGFDDFTVACTLVYAVPMAVERLHISAYFGGVQNLHASIEADQFEPPERGLQAIQEAARGMIRELERHPTEILRRVRPLPGPEATRRMIEHINILLGTMLGRTNRPHFDVSILPHGLVSYQVNVRTQEAEPLSGCIPEMTFEIASDRVVEACRSEADFQQLLHDLEPNVRTIAQNIQALRDRRERMRPESYDPASMGFDPTRWPYLNRADEYERYVEERQRLELERRMERERAYYESTVRGAWRNDQYWFNRWERRNSDDAVDAMRFSAQSSNAASPTPEPPPPPTPKVPRRLVLRPKKEEDK